MSSGFIVIQPPRPTNKIPFLRNDKVLLNPDLAKLYGVETRVLNQAASRNIKRFPHEKIRAIFEAIQQLISLPPADSKKRIGFTAKEAQELNDEKQKALGQKRTRK